MLKPFELTSSEWSRAYRLAQGEGVQERFTRSAASQQIASFQAREVLRFGARERASNLLKAAGRGEVKMTRTRAERLLKIVNTSVTHRDVVLTAMRRGFQIPAHVIAEYPGLAMRRYAGH